MYWRNSCTSEEEIGNGLRRATIGIKPRAWNDGGVLRANDKQIVLDGGMWRARGPLEARFATDLNVGAVGKRIACGDVSLAVTPVVDAKVPGDFIVDGVGNRIGRVYKDAWPNADLRYTWGGHFVKEAVVLHKGHPQVIRSQHSQPEGALVASKDGSVSHIANAKGQTKILARPAYLYLPSDPDRATVPVKQMVVVKGGQTYIDLILPDGDWAGWVLDPTWQSQPDAAAGKDTYLDEHYITTNRGTVTEIWFVSANDGWACAPLFAFAELPTGTVVSATLTLYCTYDGPVASWTVTVNPVLMPWVESTAIWDLCDTGVSWNTAGCLGAADYDSATAANQTVSGVGSYTWDVTTHVGQWMTGTANNGVVLKKSVSVGRKNIASSDYTDNILYRPKLEVTYTVPSTTKGSGMLMGVW